MKISEYKIKNKRFSQKYVFALISDLHTESSLGVIEALKTIRPDYILAAGDIFEPLLDKNRNKNQSGYELLAACSGIAPTIFSPGNHEIGGTHSWSPMWRFAKGKKKTYDKKSIELVRECGVCFLEDDCVKFGEIYFGGLCSGIVSDDMRPDLSFVERFSKIDAPKVLVCHHPEYYKKYLKEKGIDLIVSGHAHGGQWRLFGRGVFAPGQGFFPKYTSGVYDNVLVVSRGITSGGAIPRIFNPPEIVKIVIEP